MPDIIKELTCSRCGHSWYENLTKLEEQEQIIFRGDEKVRKYSTPCPNCGTRKILTVRITEEDD